MCLACEMEGEWLAYLAAMARSETPSETSSETSSEQAPGAEPGEPAKPVVTRPPAAPFVCEEQQPE